MALSSASREAHYTGNGATSTYSITFTIFAQTELTVYSTTAAGVTTTLALTTDYTVSSDLSSITLVAGSLTSGVKLGIYGSAPLTQTTDIRNQGKFLPETHENKFDYLTMLIQQMNTILSRCIKLPVANYTVTSLLPTLTASYIIAVKSDGTGFEYIQNPAQFSISTIGATPNANGGTVTTGVLVLQPADSTYGGVVTAIAQAFKGVKTFVDHVITSAATGITAFAGGGQASATVLTKSINNVTTVATSGDSVKLPAAVGGMEVIVINNGAATLNVFPFLGDAIDALAANAAYGLSTAAKVARFISPATGSWIAGSVAVSGGGVTVTGTAASPQAVVAGTGVVFAGSDMFNTMYISGSGGAVIVSANPQITAGTVTGQRLRLIVPAGANSVTLADGTGLSTDGGSALIMAAGSSADFEWNATVWFETGRRTA